MSYRRAVFDTISGKLRSNKVIVLLGARRVGKTYLLNTVQKGFEGKSLFLNGEDLDSATILTDRRVSSFRRWATDLELLIIDEAQVVPEIGKTLKLLIDSFPTLTIIASGSFAFELSNRTGEPLVGRQITYQLFPLAQIELSAHENYLETRQQLENRLIYGSYPDVLQMTSEADKKDYLKELVNAYLLKDILMYEQVKYSHKMLQLLQLVAYQTGQEVSYEELSKSLQIDRNTVERYLDLFSKVFIIFRTGGFSKNLRKEVTKSSKWYFFDNGIRNALINNFLPPLQRQDIGLIWENYLAAERMKYNSYSRKNPFVYFWRTYDQQELDWVEVIDDVISGYEFKWNDSKIKFPKAFVEAYPDAETHWINRDNFIDFVTGEI
ncbi:ATP-binding protein [Dyadobacter aurulentus]|uniref:ATP-binding protein n=1 Tax=Dyadobacter sp. UC 10 TaxID=2605428 RepID=UPI0011F31B4F|nr:ATP-binding protein [Dyadobacter sp. UC 10]KAA0991862.1 ATP-binding protein [Dyadobacter sp. UC 10]